MYNRRFTPHFITRLEDNEIFVFGSNLSGFHGGGAARTALDTFGAVWGQGVGLQGQSYAIPTMQGGAETIKPYVDQFIAFAAEHSELTFLVTRIACGIAGLPVSEIAPLFAAAIDMENVILPKDFVDVIHATCTPDHGWQAETDFLQSYRHLKGCMKNGDREAYYQIKGLRTKVYRNTIDLVTQGYYTTEDGKRVELGDGAEMMNATVYYDHEIETDAPTADETCIEVVNDDCLAVAMRLKADGYIPAVLNMANRHHPGGGVDNGAAAQEETLFRRTDLYRSLYRFSPLAKVYGLPPSSHHYPLDSHFGGIYTPGATIFRESEDQGYRLMAEPVSMDFISVAGKNRPDLTPDGLIAPHHVPAICDKIRTILRIGLAHHHDALVLGALGCGAFCNPPAHVARLFHEVLSEPEFYQKFRRITFAIIDDHNAHRPHNPEGNYRPFFAEFKDGASALPL